MSKKSSQIVAAVVTVFAFFMITWLSCKKPSQPYSCDGVVCVNGGHCYQDTLAPHKPHCACPTGFEGATCATPSVNKYLGYWNVRHHVDGSDSIGYPGFDTFYTVLLRKTATNTTVFLDNYFNNPNYNNIIFTIDSLNSDIVELDTAATNFHMDFNDFKFLAGYGGMFAPDSLIVRMYTKSLSPTTNRRTDTLTLHMWPHR